MSDTKSYMNNDNIITETVLEKLFKWLVRNPALKKDKKIQRGIDDLNKSISEFERLVNDEVKDYDPKAKKIKIKPYKLKDFF